MSSQFSCIVEDFNLILSWKLAFGIKKQFSAYRSLHFVKKLHVVLTAYELQVKRDNASTRDRAKSHKNVFSYQENVDNKSYVLFPLPFSSKFSYIFAHIFFLFPSDSLKRPHAYAYRIFMAIGITLRGE